MRWLAAGASLMVAGFDLASPGEAGHEKTVDDLFWPQA